MSGKINLNSSSLILNSDKINLGREPIWVYVGQSTNASLYPTVVSTISTGAGGCATASESQAQLTAAYDPKLYIPGDYARVNVADNNFTLCGYYHYFIVELV
jgi:hypothetical protein